MKRIPSTDVSSDESPSPVVTSAEKSSDESPSPVVTSTEKSSDEGSSPAVTSTEKSNDESPSPVVTSTDVSSDESPSPAVTSTEKSSDEGSSPAVTSTEKSSDEGSSPAVTSTEKSSDEGSSPAVTSTEKSSDESSSPDKASSGSSNTVSPCIVSYSGIFVPTVLVRGSSSMGSSNIVSSSTCKVCSASSSIHKESSDKASIVSSSTFESIGDGNYNSSFDSSVIDYNYTGNESHIYYIYYTSEGIYIVSSDGSYVFYPSSSGLEAIRDLYWMGDAISEPEENIYAKELVSGNIISGYPGRFDFAENATSITHIEFEPLMTFKRTITTAEVLLNKSVFIPELPTGRVYQYINVFVGTKGAGLPTFLKSGLVEFKVEKAWIKDNNVDESQVTLQRYNYGWVPLHTEKVGEDDKYVYFKADTPGFYFFAITEEKGEMNTS